jgi:hypothetical protein
LETRESYDRAILDFCSDNPLLQIYQVGEISHPGISDLDFLVLDSTPVVGKNVDHFLQGGNVIIMPSSLFSKINYIERFNLNLVQGAEIPVENVSSKFFDIIEILEWLPERILLIESLLGGWKIDERRILLYLKSLDRSIQKVEKMTMSHFSRPSISDIRKNYKNLDLKRISYEYHNAAENAWYTFSSSIKEITGVPSGVVDICSHYCFKNRFHKLMIYFDMLSRTNLDISKPMRDCVKIDSSDYYTNDSFKKFAINRWEILNDIFCWFKENNIQSGMIKYGWFLKK